MKNITEAKPEGAPSRMSSAISGVYVIVAMFVVIIICLVSFSRIQTSVLTSVRAFVGGEGLGLVVKNLVQANGGTIKVASEAGKGTVFIVTLPCGDVGT